MQEFIAKHKEEIAGVLRGFDRLIFRGTLRSLSYPEGMLGYLWAKQVGLTEFGKHVLRESARLQQACRAKAEALRRPRKYLVSAGESKAEVARGIAAREKIEDGLVCVLSCVEPGQTFEVYRNRETRKLGVVSRIRKCLFFYPYGIHREFGFLNARIQTGFPFSIPVCRNGREWLARQMGRAGMNYVRQDNCFPWVEDWGGQRLLDRQLRTNWPKWLGRIARELNPVHAQIFGDFSMNYYWTTYPSAWAIAVVLRQAGGLRRLYPRLVHYGISTLGSTAVRRYLGRPVRLDGEVPKSFGGEVRSDLQWRAEGMRIKHSVKGNAVKLYDKAFTAVGSVLRAETTIHRGGEFRVYRRKEGDSQGKKSWRVLRGGVADLHRRAEISERAAERYLDALAGVDEQTSLQEWLERLGQPKQWQGRRVRAVHPLGADRALLATICRGECMLNGFRNRELQQFFFAEAAQDLREVVS